MSSVSDKFSGHEAELGEVGCREGVLGDATATQSLQSQGYYYSMKILLTCENMRSSMAGRFIQPLVKHVHPLCYFVQSMYVRILEYILCVLCWEVCPLSKCPLSEVSPYTYIHTYIICTCKCSLRTI